MTNYDPIDEALNVKSEIIPTPEDVVSKKKNKVPIIALVGRMVKDKGIYEFINAAKILQKNNIQAKFLLIGGVDNFYSSSIDLNLLKKWNNQGIIEWLGFVNNVDEILKNIDFLSG